jgi:hypothetical protein
MYFFPVVFGNPCRAGRASEGSPPEDKIKMKTRGQPGSLKIVSRFVVIVAIVLSFSSCYRHYRVTIGLSRAIVEYYGIYPSIEVDITAVPASLADEIKTAGVESYFAPDSPLRAQAMPHTLRFSEEITAPVTLGYRDMGWKNWVKKNPEKLLIIVNLPYSEDMKAADKRMLTFDIKERFIHWNNVNIEIGAKQIAEVVDKPVDPRDPDSRYIQTNK